MKITRRRFNWKNFILLVICFICIISFVYSSFQIVRWNVDKNRTYKQIDVIKKNVVIKEIIDQTSEEIIKQEEEIPKYNPYWEYIKMNLIDVDFKDLKTINNQVKGWIQVNGTNINYPFVQTNNNEFYLKHSFDKKYNQAGWVFIDYRNNINGNDKNIILYAHGRLDETMFGSLKNIMTSGWLNNKSNYVIKVSTEKENSLWQIFSVYTIPTTSDYLQIEFNDNTELQNFYNMLIDRSAHKFDTTVNDSDRIITLSTCYNKDEKVVMHAKLIKKENRIFD